VTGANLGTGLGTVFAGKPADTLEFNTLTDAGDGIAFSTAGGVVTISNPLTAANIGGGEGQVFSSKFVNTLFFNRIFAATGSGINVVPAVSGVISINAGIGYTSLGGSSYNGGVAGSVYNLKTIGTASKTSCASVSTVDLDIFVAMASNVWFVRETRTTGQAGGTSTSATLHTRALNTISGATLAGGTTVTLSSNNLTFSVTGKYFIFGAAPNRGGDGNMAGVYSNTTSSFLIRGSPVFNSGDTATNSAFFSGTLTVLSGNVYSIRHYITTGRATDGLGAPTNQTGRSESYTWLVILQLSTTATN
jgi:hypothetical protein